MSVSLAGVRVGEVLRVARLRNASDVHLCGAMAPMLRIDGELERQQTLEPSAEEVAAITESLLDREASQTLNSDGDVTVALSVPDVGAVRVHAYRTANGTSVAIRLLARDIPALDALQLPPAIGELCEKPYGLVIFAGPTGSGKSTALAACIDRINELQCRHVVTIEDPIEYRHRSKRSLITQRQVRTDVPTYADAVYGALRSDPDVMLIGEMRNAGTMHAALTAAETGHLVFTTLHTGDSAQTIDRIVGSFDGAKQQQIRLQLAQTLVGIVCMRLLRRGSGAGRRAALEILVANDAVRNLIRDGKTHQVRNVISTSRHAGMQTLEGHLSDLVARGEIALSTARAVTERPDEVRAPDHVLE